MTLDITQNISQLIASQFPAIYREEGSNIVAFLQAYYEFLESDPKYAVYRNRDMFDSTDIDEALDEFVIHFKKKYLADFPYLSGSDTRFLVKHIIDQYRAKGSEQSLKLFMKLAFGEDIEVYYPSSDIFKLSDSKWVEPKYVEVTPSLKTASFLGQRVYSDRFNASGVVENIITKRVNGKIFDVVYLSDIIGQFNTGDTLTVDGNIEDSPVVTGSLTSVDISYGGANFKIGDLLDVWSDNGKDGVVKVQEIFRQTETVSFRLIDGGYGYTLNNNTQIYVANSVVFIDNTSLQFNHFDPVVQVIQWLYANTANVVVGSNAVSTSNASVYGTVVGKTGTYFIVNTRVGTFAGSPSVTLSGSPALTVTSVVTANTEGRLIANSFDRVGVWRNSANATQFYESANSTNNAYILINGVEKKINSVADGSGASFEIGTLSDVSTVSVITDRISPYTAVPLNSTNYGFRVTNTNIDSVISDALNFANIDIGTIQTLKNVNPGTNYDASTYIYVETPIVKDRDYRDYVITIIPPIAGSFSVGDKVNQNNTVFGRVKSVSGTTLTIRNLTFGSFLTANSTPLVGTRGSALIGTVAQDYTANTMGTNAYLSSDVFGEPGTVAKLKIVSSGVGYVEDEPVMMTHRATANANPVSLRGIAKLGTSGKQLGYWETKTSHINEVDVRIRDNKYYQEYSYDVIAAQSFDKYEKAVRSILHVAGTALFGSVAKSSNVALDINVNSSIVKTVLTASYLTSSNGDFIITGSTGLNIVVQTEVEV
jgi:hypothetical protein